MKRSGAYLLGACFLAMVVSFTLAVAAPSTDPADPGSDPTPATNVTAEADQPLTPRMQEITDLIEAERETLRQLNAQLDAAIDQNTHLQIIKQIEQLKQDTELGILEIQLKYARLEGNIDAVAELEAAILQLTSPPEPGEPQPRQAPDSAQR